MCGGAIGAVDRVWFVMPVGIAGVGHAVPPTVWHNDQLASRGLDTSHEWIASRTGIHRRHIANGIPTSELAVAAARMALIASGLAPDAIDMVIVATTSGDHLGFPSTACLVQDQLGLSRAGAFDLGAACAGFVYALGTGAALLTSGGMSHVLVIGADVLSNWVDWTDRRSCVLFGDGAGAVVLSPTAGRGIEYTRFYANGALAPILDIPGGGAREPLSDLVLANRRHLIHMDGKAVFKVAIHAIGSAITQALADTGLNWDEIDWFVPHQANQRIIDQVVETHHIPPHKVLSSIQDYGNTSAASIPLELSLAVQSGRLLPGHRVMCVGFGAGFTWAVSLFEWGVG